MSRSSFYVAAFVLYVVAIDVAYAFDCGPFPGCANVAGHGATVDPPNGCIGYSKSQCILNIWSNTVVPGAIQCVSYVPAEFVLQTICPLCESACISPRDTDVREGVFTGTPPDFEHSCNHDPMIQVTIQRTKCSGP